LDADPATLSGGEAERVGLAMVILSRFDLTLLDEPTNNLDHDGLERLERWVAEHPGGLVLVSHDRAFLERAVTTVIEIDHHHHTVSQFNGGWEAFLAERSRASALAEERYADYVDERDRLAGRTQQQREWAAKGASRARKHPADGDKFRRNHQLAQTEKLVGKAKATQRALDRLEEVEKPWQPWDLRFTIGQAPRSADVVVAFDRAVLRRGDFSLGPIDLEVRWAERVAVVGPNGSGKSTLLAAMLGRLEPEHGRVKLGSGVIGGELDQGRGSFGPQTGGVGLDPGSDRETLIQGFQDRSGLAIHEARSVLAKFGLDAEAVSRPASSLSPGERTRAQLALFQATGVNLLVLDEPTNHLDLPAIEQLESALAGFDGTVVLVTHDRRLLENVRITRTVDLAADTVGGSR
ncbi:MAG: ATP-binding cassette domain-containing protein, partial [Acidimicrobiales bacterium]